MHLHLYVNGNRNKVLKIAISCHLSTAAAMASLPRLIFTTVIAVYLGAEKEHTKYIQCGLVGILHTWSTTLSNPDHHSVSYFSYSHRFDPPLEFRPPIQSPIIPISYRFGLSTKLLLSYRNERSFLSIGSLQFPHEPTNSGCYRWLSI